MSRDESGPAASETAISVGRATPAQHSGAPDAPDAGDPTPAPGADPHTPDAPALAPDLARIVEAWADLPEAVRAGIVAMVKAAAPGKNDR